jgi:hypothetical protein
LRALFRPQLTLGDYVVAYKQRAIFVGVFVGTPVVWQWNLIPGGEAGAVGQEAVCDIGGAHFIVSNDNFWLFDGTRPVHRLERVLFVSGS